MAYLFSEIVTSGSLLGAVIYESDVIDGLLVETVDRVMNSQIALFNFQPVL
jgi:hypothetical protein